MAAWTIVDTHAHLHDKEFAADFDAVLSRAQEAGVERIVLVGEDADNSAVAVEHAEASACCWAAVGLHPHRAKVFGPHTMDALRKLIGRSSKVVAIGEIGLDLHYDFATFAEQETALRAQLALARETELPIIVHCREAYPQALGILREEAAAVGSQPWGVMHCYFGTLEQARAFYDMGLLLGIGGSVTFRNAEQVREVVKAMPLESLVLETDAPYMAPVPYRGKRNEPAWLTLVVEKIAEVKGLAPEIVAHATTENAWRLFRWPLPAQGNRAATEPA